MTTKKREYEKPSVRVFELKQKLMLHSVSGNNVNATMSGTWTEEDI